MANIAIPPRQFRTATTFSTYVIREGGSKGPTSIATVHTVSTEGAPVGKAYILSIGVNAYADRSLDLSYAVNDADLMKRQLAKLLEHSKQFTAVRSLAMTALRRADGKVTGSPLPTKTNIENVLSNLAGHPSPRDHAPVLWTSGGKSAAPGERLQAEDTLIIHFSGHGIVDNKGEFRLLPHDTQRADRAIKDGRIVGGITASELAEWLTKIEAENIILIIDACHSAAAFEKPGIPPGPFGNSGLGQLAFDKKIRILAASQASELAMELRRTKHGLLSFVLTKGTQKSVQYTHADDDMPLQRWLESAEGQVHKYYTDLRQDQSKGLRSLIESGGRSVHGASPRSFKSPARLLQRPALFVFGDFPSDIVLWPGFRQDRTNTAIGHLREATRLMEANDPATFERAEEEFNEAVFWSRESEDIRYLAVAHERRGMLYVRMGNTDKAEEDLRLAQAYFAKAGYQAERARIWITMAEIAEGEDEIEKSIEWYAFAEALAKDTGDWGIRFTALDRLAKSYRAAGQPQIATTYCEEMTRIPQPLPVVDAFRSKWAVSEACQ